MSHSGNSSIKLLGGQFVYDLDAVLMLHDGRIGPGVINSDVEVILLQGLVDVDDLSVAHVGAIFLEGEAQDNDVAVEHLNALLQHQFDGFCSHILTHSIIHATTGKDNLWVVAVTLGALCQIVGVNTDAVAAHQTGTEGQEIPLGACGLQHVEGVNTHLVEDLAQFVHEGDVDVALRVLNDLGGLCHLDGGGQVCAGSDDAGIHLVDILTYLRGAAGGHFLDVLHGVLFVARINALGAVAAIEVNIHLQTADLLHHGDTFVLGDTGIDGALIDHHIALADDLANGGAGTHEGREVGIVVIVHGRRHCHDVEVAVTNLLNVAGEDETVVVDCILQDVVSHLKGSIVTCHQRVAPLLVHVKTHSLVLRRKQACQRQANVT